MKNISLDEEINNMSKKNRRKLALGLYLILLAGILIGYAISYFI